MSDTIPIHELVLPDQPDVWKALTAEQIAIANERNEYGLLTRRAAAMRKQAQMDRWFLIRNVWNWKSRNGRVERYFTTSGIERPYHGIWSIFAAYNDIVQDDELTATITMEAHRIGAHEPISVAKAQQLYDRIRHKLGLGSNAKQVERRLGPRPGGWA